MLHYLQALLPDDFHIASRMLLMNQLFLWVGRLHQKCEKHGNQTDLTQFPSCSFLSWCLSTSSWSISKELETKYPLICWVCFVSKSKLILWENTLQWEPHHRNVYIACVLKARVNKIRSPAGLRLMDFVLCSCGLVQIGTNWWINVWASPDWVIS